MSNHYTFGDNDRACERLCKLALLYESETRELIERRKVASPKLAVDLGCGPGWSTRLLAETSGASRTVGLDASASYIATARRIQGPGLEFIRHDVTRIPFPVPEPDLLLCRFLLTHLRRPERALAAWARAVAPSACLLIHETERLEAGHPALREYYELLGRMQAHYGQLLYIGAALDGLLARTTWTIKESKARILEKPVPAMAELHVANLRTWREDPYARRAFDAVTLDRIEASLTRIAGGDEDGGIVYNTARQIIAVQQS